MRHRRPWPDIGDATTVDLAMADTGFAAGIARMSCFMVATDLVEVTVFMAGGAIFTETITDIITCTIILSIAGALTILRILAMVTMATVTMVMGATMVQDSVWDITAGGFLLESDSSFNSRGPPRI